jgi:hypothetical protein
MKLDRTKFPALVADNSIHEELPPLHFDSAMEPFDGLKIDPGLRCIHCPKVAGTRDSMIKHHQRCHLKEHATPKSWPSCHIQRLTSSPGKHCAYWEVTLPKTHEEATIDSMLEELQINAMAMTRVDVKAVNARSISPWLLFTGWHVHIQDYETKELLSLISIPKEDEFPGLKNLVRTYMLKATDLMDSTDDLCLQYLNTADPAKT